MSYLVADAQNLPVSVLFHLDLVEQLRKLSRRGLLRRDSRSRGVLYGRIDRTNEHRTVLTVHACEPARGLEPLGLVRSWVRGHLYLDKQDRDVLRGSNAIQPYSVLLVIRAAAIGVPVAGAFLCESGAVLSENSFAEFPLDRSRIVSGGYTLLKDSGVAPVPDRKPVVSTRRRFRMPGWAWFPIGAAGLAMLAIFAAGMRPASSASPGPSENASIGDSRILLSLERAGNDLLLRWDPNQAKVRAADHAVLRINDGTIHRTVPLDTSQLQVGAAQYHPVSSDVEFQLEIPGASGALSDPVRFISGPPAPQGLVASKSSSLAGETSTKGESDRARVQANRGSPMPNANVQIWYEPITPSTVRRAVNRVRGVPLLRFRTGEFVAPRATHQETPVVSAASAGELIGDQRVELRANIDKNGRVKSVQPVSSRADKKLVALAENAVRRWQFSPARLNDRPVASSAHFTVTFAKRSDSSQFASR